MCSDVAGLAWKLTSTKFEYYVVRTTAYHIAMQLLKWKFYFENLEPWSSIVTVKKMIKIILKSLEALWKLWELWNSGIIPFTGLPHSNKN